MKLSCNVIRDLLPLYHDGVSSDESSVLVDDHLAECENCRAILNELRGEIEMPCEAPDDLAPLERIEKNVQQGKKKAWLRGAAAALAVMLIAFAGVNVWWYNDVYLFYAQFAEGHDPAMSYSYNEAGEVISSRVEDPSRFQWHTDGTKYFCVVHLPDYLGRNGDAALHAMFETDRNGSEIDVRQEGKSVHARMYIGRELYTYSVHLTIIERTAVPGKEQLEEKQTEECVMLDWDLNQVYLDHWDEEWRARQDQLLKDYNWEIMNIVEAAWAQWPFLTE